MGPWSTPAHAAAPPTLLPSEIVTATRIAQPLDQTAATVRVLADDELRAIPSATLDGALRSFPGFSLFRRSDSFTANPTAQGVSLRGLGPSGASRSLVLLDSIPLNDPFGGWVAWTKLPRESLWRIEIVPGGGAAAWGNAALGGVVHLLSETPTPRRRATLALGDYGTRSLEFAHAVTAGATQLELGGRAFATDGFVLVAPERRGPIDVPAWSRHRFLDARWSHSLTRELTVTATGRTYEEKRGNGTPYQKNGSREKFLSLKLAASHRPLAWQAVACAQDQSFSSTFSGVNATRTAETPASDQFAVPSTAFGAGWSATWDHPHDARTSFGADTRLVRGETREHFTFVAGNFTRLRVAGGRQWVGGGFAVHERPLVERLRLTVGSRLDHWRDTDGHRRESDRTTGIASRNDRYPTRDGTNFGPSAGLSWTPRASAWQLRANAQRAFRRPTLNELYRPFRVGANVTEANADLRTERVTSGEIGLQWTLLTFPPKPVDPPGERSSWDIAASRTLTLGATAFTNDLRDAVGNVTIARGPGTFPIVGTIAAGGVGRQRLNLDRTRVRGLELSAKWTLLNSLAVTAEALVNDAKIRRATVAPALLGKRVAQVPRRSASLGAMWQAPARLTFAPRVRYIGRQFEDDENQLTLGAVVIADLSVSRSLTKNLELFVTAENLGNARIETGRSADGLVNIGTPRLVIGGLRGSW